MCAHKPGLCQPHKNLRVCPTHHVNRKLEPGHHYHQYGGLEQTRTTLQKRKSWTSSPGAPAQGRPCNRRIDRQASPPQFIPLIHSSSCELLTLPPVKNNRDRHHKPRQRPPTAASPDSPPPPPRSRPKAEGQWVGQHPSLPGLQEHRDSPHNPLRAWTAVGASERTRPRLLNYSSWWLICCFLKTRPVVGSQVKPTLFKLLRRKNLHSPGGPRGRLRLPGPSGGST